MDYDDIIEVGCDGCDRLMGAVTIDEWNDMKKNLILCPTCDVHCCAPDTLRRVGMTVLAAQIERQWSIEHGDITTAGWSDVDEAELEGVPF